VIELDDELSLRSACLPAGPDDTTGHVIAGIQENGEACVCDLTEPLGLTQPTISHHLKILVDAGIFTRDKRGVWVY
jgi:DNA-binding transcriptional ArsR family regulator